LGASVSEADGRRNFVGTRSQPSLGLLLSPAFLDCLAIMRLNDHVLKRAYPDFITGKLSDVTGIFNFYLCLPFMSPTAASDHGRPDRRGIHRL